MHFYKILTGENVRRKNGGVLVIWVHNCYNCNGLHGNTFLKSSLPSGCLFQVSGTQKRGQSERFKLLMNPLFQADASAKVVSPFQMVSLLCGSSWPILRCKTFSLFKLEENWRA